MLSIHPSNAAEAPENPQPTMQMSRSATALNISGSTSSTAHEIILRQTAQRFFADQHATIDLFRDAQTPPGWALVTELVLRTIANTDIARASISAKSVFIEGLSSDPVAYENARRRIDAVLLDGMSITSNVSAISSAASFSELCQSRFTRTANSGRVEFTLSTANFTSNALPLLDALVEIAADCPATRIRVTGHTDSSGDPAANDALGHARAARVIEYMTNRGLPVNRFAATVAHSTGTENQGSDAKSRKLNRRVELEMLLP